MWLINDNRDNMDIEVVSIGMVDAVCPAHENFFEFGQLIIDYKFFF